MNLDVRTMYMAMGAACFIVAIAIFIFHAGRFRRDGTLAWAIGWVFQGAFWVLVGLRGVIWDFVSIVVAHTFLAASFSILYAAVREFQERTYDRGTLLLPAVATFMFFWYFSVYVDNVFYRVIFISLLSILQIIAIVWALFRDTSVQERRSYGLTGFAFLVMEGIWIIRFLEGFTLPYGHLSALEATTFRNTSVLVALGTVILSSIGFVLMARERAEQTLREGEEQLRQAEEKSRLLIKYAPSMIYEVDYNRAAFKSVNDVMCQFLGYTREELLAMSPFDLLNDEGKAVFRERIQRKLAGEAINDSVEYKSRTKDGREVYGVLNMTFTYKDEKPEGAVVVAHDITERKQAEARLAADVAALTRMHALSGRLLGGGGIQPLLQEVMDAAVAIVGAERGTLQLLEGDSLRIEAHHGHQQPFLEFFESAENRASVCGEATRRGERVVVPDVETSPLFAGTPSQAVLREAGVRAVQSTPMASRTGKLLGILTTQWGTPYTPDEHDLWRIDLLVRQAADLIEYEKAEEALRDAYERVTWLARFPEQNPNPIVRASADGTVLYCNPACTKHHGWKCEVEQVLPKELLPLISRAMSKGSIQEDVQLDGRVYIIWVEPFPGEGYANVYGRDITERKRSEEALREREKRLVADLEAMTRLQKIGTLFVSEGNLESVLGEIVEAAIAISGADFGNLQLLNPESSDLHIAAQRGFPTWWLDSWKRAAKGQGTCGTALERGERVIVEDVQQSPIFVGTPALEIQLKAGVRAVQSTPLVSRSGKPLGMFSTHYKTPHRPDDRALRLLDLLARQAADIIERAQAEEALRQSEERLRLAQQAAQVGTFEWNLQTDRDVWTAELETIYGLRLGEFAQTGAAWAQLIHPEDRANTLRLSQQSIQNGELTTGEWRVVWPDGSVHWLAGRWQVLKDTSGQPLRMSGVNMDITERKRMEEELRRSRDELEMRVQERTEELETINEESRAENEERLRIEIELRESENRLRELSSALLNAQEKERKVIAQEIHDSMGASLAATKFKVETALKEMGNDNPQTKAALESVIPIIQETIEEARRIQMSLRPSMLDDLGILATINWFSRQYESVYPGIHLKKEIDIQEHEVPGHLKIVIYRVLQEALNNIAKHSKASVVVLYLRKAKQAIQLVIRDSGQGFDLEEVSSRKGSAKGLGLDSMRERAELSGGFFSIESRKGAGTVIRATWPLNS